MIRLSEAGLNMVRKVTGWTDVTVRACLEGMGEFDEDETEISGLEVWLRKM
jgi:importin-5